LTDDRQITPRRNRKLTLLEVFAGAYILYPKYFDPIAQTPIEIENAISILNTMKQRASA
jgi:capsular polysaccharide export protein